MATVLEDAFARLDGLLSDLEGAKRGVPVPWIAASHAKTLAAIEREIGEARASIEAIEKQLKHARSYERHEPYEPRGPQGPQR